MVARVAVRGKFKGLDEPLRDFIKRKGGLNKCASRFARRLGRCGQRCDPFRPPSALLKHTPKSHRTAGTFVDVELCKPTL